MRGIFTFFVVITVALATGCSRARQYELRGQILAVDAARQEVTIKHDDIKGFMPGMTMPFKVKDASLLNGRTPGELVTATLVVEDANAYLADLRVTGKAPLTEPAPARAPADVLDVGATAPDVTLVDERGRTRQLNEWRGTTLAVTFIYTRCPLPDFCPRMDRNFAEAQRAILADPRLRERVHLLSVSFDPGYDTPAVLAAHAKRVGAEPATWNFATGSREAIDTFAAKFGVSVIRADKDMQEIVHNLRTAVIAGNGTIVRIFNGNDWTPDELVAALKEASDIH
ncbi:MAG TPA: SCO family protein [Vicinamibacterales bacterium]